jgi:prolyl-tRNA synthetase
MAYVNDLAKELRKTQYAGRDLIVEVDDRDIGGARGWEWIKKGIPVRAEIGPRDMAQDSVFMARRDHPHREKSGVKREAFVARIPDILEDIQNELYQRAQRFRDENTRKVDDQKDFYDWFTPKNPQKPEIHAGFALSHWCGDGNCEKKIKEDLNVTIRCIPLDAEKEQGACICCGNPSKERVVFAKAY